MMELRARNCYSKMLSEVFFGLAFVDGLIALLAFFQLIRIHCRNSRIGWTRQKVFHLMIGSSNLGYSIYFALTPVAACKNWTCWSHICGFIVMACPKILFLAAFLLLLSFWVDFCHESNDEDEDEEYSPRASLLEKNNKPRTQTGNHRKCCSFRSIHIGSRQKIVILVTLMIFLVMITTAVLIWIGRGKNPIDSLVVARVYVDFFAVAVLLLGGALACYGLVLCLKMRKVRSERASSEMWKVAGLAIVSVICFSSSAFVAIFTDIPLANHWHEESIDEVYTSVLLVVYFFVGSSIPAIFVLWVMREMPQCYVINRQEEIRTIAFIRDSSVNVNTQRWVDATTMQNQVSRASPI